MARFCFQAKRRCSLDHVNRSSKCLFNGEVGAIQSSPKCPHGDLDFVCPIAESLRFSIKLDNPVIRPIPHLHMGWSPTNIAGFIVLVVINAIKRVSLWALAKAGNEPFKCEEFRVNLDPSSAPIVVSIILRVVASCFHVQPCSIFLGPLYSNFSSCHANRLAGGQLEC